MIKRVEHKEKAKERLRKCKSGMIGANILSTFLQTASINAFSGVIGLLAGIVISASGIGSLIAMLEDGVRVERILMTADVNLFLLVVMLILFIIVIAVGNQAILGASDMGNNRYYLYTAKHGIKPAMPIVLEGFNDFWNAFLVYARRALIVLLYRLPGFVLIILAFLLIGNAPSAAVFMIVLGILEIIIAGIVANLQLWAVAWVKADRPELSSGRCIEESRKFCKGHLGDLLIYRLSFLGWDILSAITGGLVGILYYAPYFRAASALVYQELKGKSIELVDIENAEAVMGKKTPGELVTDLIDRPTPKVAVGQVIGISGVFQGKRVELAPGVPVVVGRSDRANIRIVGSGAESVSGTHCTVRFIREADCYEVTDSSTNGTFVSGKRLPKDKPVSLPCGAEISLGDDRNKLRLEKIYR